MRKHPISPVTEPLQYRAIGLVRATYCPNEPDCFTKGKLVDKEGVQVEAVVLGRVMALMRRHLDIGKPHLWVVYPRCRKEDELHLQIAGVWEPSTLETTKANADLDIEEDKLPEGDDYFSIRGELIFTKPETSDLVVKIRQRARDDDGRMMPFKLKLKGDLPIKALRHFISLDVRRRGQKLYLENAEILAQIPSKNNKNKDKYSRQLKKGEDRNRRDN
ncbi:hypothetical protein [Prochlorococcus sp. MIT 1341]|uniref:hypothetical protein n=1 Tax=Prochlorococcus sp. MIT 1341 TaxID=3096221 RepID=UPI002A75BDB9|nr:hypothetical protein [Prochlorococcus sp. MIT 1341]